MVDKKLTVFVCTYNPDFETLELCCKHIISNSRLPDKVVIVDNSYSEIVSLKLLEICNRYSFQYLLNPTLGVSHSRLLAMNNLESEFLCFVDDDNLLSEFYFENALNYMDQTPKCVALGGAIQADEVLKLNDFLTPALPYFGIRDLGTLPLSSDNEMWNEVMPVTAGGVYRSNFIKYFISNKNFKEKFTTLGRVGEIGLSGEDTYLVSKAKLFGGFYTYLPSLIMFHRIEPSRLKFFHLCKLFFGFGKTEVILSTENLTNTNLFYLIHSFIKLTRDHKLASTYLVFNMIGREFQIYKKINS
jgi:hypothetical protein